MNEKVRPFDRHGREMRAGDLMGHPQYRLFRLVSEFSSYKRSVAGEVVVQCSDGSARYWADCEDGRWGNYEVIARGSPTDPVPERFDPERDAQGRPVLGDETIGPVCLECRRVVHGGELWLHSNHRGPLCQVCFDRAEAKQPDLIYASGEEPMVGDTVGWRADDLPETWGTAIVESIEKGYCYARKTSGLNQGHLGDWSPRSLRLISRATPPRDTMVEELRPPVNGAPIDFSRVGSVKDVKDYEECEREQRKRYKAFDARVREIVAEEAPAAKVVTDYAGMIRDLEYPGFVASYNCGNGWVDYWIGAEATLHMVEADLRARFRKMREELGARAMGKVGAKERGR